MQEALFGGGGFVPDIPWLQAWLESAWRRGFDMQGSDQLGGGVQGTHAWIGTTEAAALLRQFGLRARVVDFQGARARVFPAGHPLHGLAAPMALVVACGSAAAAHGDATVGCWARQLAEGNNKAGLRGAADWARKRELMRMGAAGAEDVPDGKRQRSSDGWGTRIQRGGSQKKFPESDEQDGKDRSRPLSQDGMRVHPNVECDGCGVHPIRGTRFQSKARLLRPPAARGPAARPLGGWCMVSRRQAPHRHAAWGLCANTACACTASTAAEHRHPAGAGQLRPVRGLPPQVPGGRRQCGRLCQR